MNIDRLREEIEFGLQNLDEVYSRILKFRNTDVDVQILLSALSYECIGYFNAVEHLIIRFLKSLQKPVPSGPTSHRDTLLLFENVSRECGFHISQGVMQFMRDMMAFRHVATKIYGFLIDWDKLKVIVDGIEKNHIMTKQAFIDLLEVLSKRQVS